MPNQRVKSTTVHPGDPIAVLRREPEDFTKSLRLTFRSSHDDLDWLRLARIRTANGRTFALVRHRHAPRPGTEVVAASLSTDLWADIVAVLRRLKLTEEDLAWRHPAAKRSASLKVMATRGSRSRTQGRISTAKRTAPVTRTITPRRNGRTARKK